VATPPRPPEIKAVLTTAPPFASETPLPPGPGSAGIVRIGPAPDDGAGVGQRAAFREIDAAAAVITGTADTTGDLAGVAERTAIGQINAAAGD
jgi:hypothetical protein